MLKVLKRLLYALWLGVAGVLIVAAVVTVVARQLLAQVPGYRTQIETLASHYLQQRVRIGQIDVGWQGLEPRVTLHHIQLRGAPGAPALKLAEITLRLSIWNSLLARQPVPDLISLSGARLSVTRGLDGHLSLGGLVLPLAGSRSGAGGHLPAWLTKVTYQLQDAQVVIQDLPEQRQYRFSHVTLLARPVAEGLALAGGFTPSPRLGKRVTFAGQLHRRDTAATGGWGGRFYLDLEALHLAALPVHTWLPQLPALQGELSARLWSDWSAGHLTQVLGHLSVQALALGTPAKTPTGLTGLRADLRWQALPDGWRFQGTRLQLIAGSSAWPVDAFEVARHQVEGHAQLTGWVHFLRLQDMTPMLLQLPWLPKSWAGRLAPLAATGDLEDLRFAVKQPGRGTPELAVSSTVSGLSFNPHGSQPGLQGLNGRLALTQQAGSLDITPSTLTVTVPAVFDHPLPAAQVQGTLFWQRGAAGDEIVAPHFQVRNTDFALQGQLGLWVPGRGAPQINLRLGFDRAQVVAAKRYLPVKRLPPDLVSWLDKALQGGTVTGGDLILRGDPRDFPFRQHRGVFEADLKIHDGVLDYFRNWPALRAAQGVLSFHNFSLQAHVQQGRMLSSRLSDVEVAIPDLSQAVLGIQGQGVGPLSDIAHYLSFTPLGDGRKALFDEIQAGGQTRFGLTLSLPLKKSEMHRWSLAGQGRIQAGHFALPDQDFALQHIDGQVQFTQRSLKAQDIKAVFKGAPVVLGASTHRTGLATLTMDGHLSINRLFGAQSLIARYARGSADWRVALTLPMTTPDYRRYGLGLTLVSGLKGVRISLPAPVGKTAAQSVGLVVQRSLTHDHAPIYVRYGRTIQARFELSGKPTCLRLERGDLRVSAGTPVLPATGVDVSGYLPFLDADAWRRELAHLPTPRASASCPGTAGLSGETFRHVAMGFGELDLFGRRLLKTRIEASRTTGDWTVHLTSKVIAGRLQLPVVLKGGRPVRFDLSKLDLDGPQTPQTAPGKPLNPATLPPLMGHIETLTVAGRTLHNVQLSTSPTREGLQIHLAQVDEPHLKAQAQGTWELRPDGHTLTRIQLEANSDDAGKALHALNVEAGLVGGQGHLSATLNWPGGPDQFGWGSLKGHANFQLKDGRLMQVNPGQAGRLLGLLNLAALPQRLSFNFGDVFDKGFTFNDMSGQFALRQGNLYTQDTQIRGVSADMSITGRVGMVARDYDTQVTIVPQVQSTVAIAGAVIGGPVAGAAVYLLDRLLGIGKQLDKAVELRYHVSGSWDAPKIVSEDETNPTPTPPPRTPPAPKAPYNPF